MRDSERFRRRAEKTAALARQAPNAELRRQLEDIARDWLTLAEKAEREEAARGAG